ncbi:hypothetical protein K438DRAFT_1973594 [Mycena galopus ATCC 62051]|nr:hypothetical protein K438DRAFT_1973594 [Mycena galopus ATCC 62051]
MRIAIKIIGEERGLIAHQCISRTVDAFAISRTFGTGRVPLPLKSLLLLTDEVAIFTAATDAFTRANLNTTTAESLARLASVAHRLRACGKELIDTECYEVSLVGMGTPAQVSDMLEELTRRVPVERLAGHFHYTYGTAVADVLTALDYGVRTIDTSVGGLGGCPYSPGATGNVATEDAEGRMRASFRRDSFPQGASALAAPLLVLNVRLGATPSLSLNTSRVQLPRRAPVEHRTTLPVRNTTHHRAARQKTARPWPSARRLALQNLENSRVPARHKNLPRGTVYSISTLQSRARTPSPPTMPPSQAQASGRPLRVDKDSAVGARTRSGREAARTAALRRPRARYPDALARSRCGCARSLPVACRNRRRWGGCVDSESAPSAMCAAARPVSCM